MEDDRLEDDRLKDNRPEDDRLEIIRLEERFKDVPLEEDTAILHAHFGKLGGFDVKCEFWVWETYAGACLIFLKEDIAALSKEKIIELISTYLNRNDIQLSDVNGKYLFANYDVRDYAQ